MQKRWKIVGQGELLVTSMDRDGTQVGYDNELMSRYNCSSKYPSYSFWWSWKPRSLS
jgi:cyclase